MAYHVLVVRLRQIRIVRDTIQGRRSPSLVVQLALPLASAGRGLGAPQFPTRQRRAE